MATYVGLDVALKATSICIVEADGQKQTSRGLRRRSEKCRNRKNPQAWRILALPTRTRNRQNLEVAFAETASKLMCYWNPTLSR